MTKRDGDHDLPDEQPLRYFVRTEVAPLRINLPADGRQQNSGGDPANQFGRA
jgi:hypothetical protein